MKNILAVMLLAIASFTVVNVNAQEPTKAPVDPKTQLTEVEALKVQNLSLVVDNLTQSYRVKEFQDKMAQVNDQVKQLVEAIEKNHPGYTFDLKTGTLVKKS